MRQKKVPYVFLKRNPQGTPLQKSVFLTSEIHFEVYFSSQKYGFLKWWLVTSLSSEKCVDRIYRLQFYHLTSQTGAKPSRNTTSEIRISDFRNTPRSVFLKSEIRISKVVVGDLVEL